MTTQFPIERITGVGSFKALSVSPAYRYEADVRTDEVIGIRYTVAYEDEGIPKTINVKVKGALVSPLDKDEVVSRARANDHMVVTFIGGYASYFVNKSSGEVIWYYGADGVEALEEVTL